MTVDSAETQRLLTEVRAGDRSAVERLFTRHRATLHRFVNERLDANLAKRLDASDIVQDAQVVMSSRLADFLERQPMPFQTWTLKTVFDCLAKARRTHILTEKRSVRREELVMSAHSSQALVHRLVTSSGSVGEGIVREETAAKVRGALAELNETDREILVMRYVDSLSMAEIADILSLTTEAVGGRHGRALKRLHKVLARFEQGDRPNDAAR
jgi:RNA polymerase sigma-70 factor (ECF subfamily)